MSQLIAADAGASDRQRDAGRREDRAGPGTPTGEVRGEVGISPRCQLVGPEVLPAGVRHRARQLGEGDADAGRDQSDEDDAVDDQDRPARVDARHQRRRYAEPRVGQRETHAQDGQDGEVPLHVLGVAHLRQFQRIGIERLEVSDLVGRGGAADFHFFFDRHFEFVRLAA